MASDIARYRRPLAAILLAISAFAFQRGATLPWGDVASGGATLRVSPIGITRVAGPDAAATPRAQNTCRWWPIIGDATLCAIAPGGERARARLLFAYPLLVAGLWSAVAALFLLALRKPRNARLRAATAWLPTLAALGALVLMWREPPRALTVLQGAPWSLNAAGFALTLLAAVATGLAGMLEFSTRDTRAR